jgi:ligand-binding SRPBCC domain-containing protein
LEYRHAFRIRAPLAAVAEFHFRSASLAAITPPPLIVRVQQAPALLHEGAEIEFTIWLGPLPMRWQARIEDVSSRGFTDRQLRGPFQEWNHHHAFVPLSEVETEVVDEIHATLRPHGVWGLVGWAMWLGLPALFAYRAWKTRRLLKAFR